MDDLLAVANRLSLSLSPDQTAAFDTYLRELIAENPRAGLTSLTDREEIIRRHFGESLALLRLLEDLSLIASPAIDVGAGGGFPGLPLKIARPQLQLTLVEATGKKAAFLDRTVRLLGLEGARVLHARAEDVARQPGERESYRLAMARAVAPLRTLLELTLPFLQVGGALAAPKGSGAPREVREAARALEILGGEIEGLHELDVSGPGPAPTVVIVRKTASTPERYPRRPGTPARRPL
jgi:16S rRNA (guanine527-N7)-methyltransferase